MPTIDHTDLVAARAKQKKKAPARTSSPRPQGEPGVGRNSAPNKTAATKIKPKLGPPAPTVDEKRNARARTEIERRVNDHNVVPVPKYEGGGLANEGLRGRGQVLSAEQKRREDLRTTRRVRQAVKVLYDRSTTDNDRTEARLRLTELGLVSRDHVTPNEGGDHRNVVEDLTIPGTKISFLEDGSGHRQRIYGRIGAYKDQRPRQFDSVVADLLKDTGKALLGTHSAPHGVAGTQRAGLLPEGVGAAIDRAAKRGVFAGGRGLLEGLSRPGQAVESAVGKGLVAAHVIKDTKDSDVGHKIHKARGPLDVLLHGNGEDGVTGGDILQGVTGDKQSRPGGIFVDFATDPLMWFGAGLLEKGAQKTAVGLAERMKVAGVPEDVLSGLKVQKLLERAHETGDADPLLAELKAIAKEHGVSTRGVGRTSGERAAKKGEGERMKQARIDESRQILEDLRAGKSVGQVSEKGRNLYVPDVAGQEAIKSAARLAKQRELRPGIRLRLLDPLGREHAALPLPIPKRLADLKLLPVFGKNGRKALTATRLAERAHAEVLAHGAALREVDAQRRALNGKLMQRVKEVGRDQAHAELGPVRDQIDSMEKELKISMKRRLITAQDEEVEKGKVALTQSAKELVDRGNVRRMTRSVAPVADEFGRTTQMRFYKQVLSGIEDHLGNLNDPKVVKSLEKIQLHRFARSDTGAQSVIRKAGVKLTPKENSVMRELDKVDAQMAKFGRATGTLKRQLEDYGGPRIWNPEGTSVDQIVENINSRLGASSFFAKHRSHPAVSDLADPERLANKIREHSTKDMTPEEARAHADAWHDTAMIRNAQELMMRQEQRAGDTLNMDQLPPTFQRAAHLAEGMTPRGSESTVPLLNIDKEQGLGGIAKLNRSEAAQQGYKLPTRDPLDTTPKEAIKSIDADLARVEHIRKTTKSGTQYDKDLRKWANRLRVQKAALLRERAVSEGDLLSGRATEADESVLQAGEQLDAVTEELDNALSEASKSGDWDRVTQLLDMRRQLEERRAQLDNVSKQQDAQSLEFLNQGDEDLTSGMRGRDLLARDKFMGDKSQARVPFDDVVGDVTSRLPDFRESNFFPVLDMRNSYFYRTRSEGVNVAFRSRWKGIDAAEGRDVRDADASYRAQDGTEGNVSDLEQWEVPPRTGSAAPPNNPARQQLNKDLQDLEGDEAIDLAATLRKIDRDRETAKEPAHVFWYDRAQDRVFEADEIKTTKPALVPNQDRTLFWDLNTKRQYAYPQHVSASVGERIDEVIQPMGPDGKVHRTRLWPVDVINAADMEAKRAGEYDVVFKTGMESALGKVLSQLRYGVTSLWPAYHTRNLISDTLKSLQADSGVMFHPIANAKLASMAATQGKLGGSITIKGLGTMPSEDFLLMADAFGLRSGHHVAEVSRIAETGEFPVRGRASRTARALGPGGAVGSKAVDFGVRREDVTRFITFAQRMRANGGDAADAMMYMIKHHFNYNDLTIYEKRTIRNLFLFYTWYRKNIPLQLAELVHRPGFMSAVAHSYSALAAGETPINENWSKIHPFFPDLSGKMPKRGTIPDYLQDRLQSVGISWNGHAALFGFGAPWSDLSLLKASPEGLRDWAGMMNPAATTGLQLAFGEDLLTGRQFKQSESGGASNAVNAVMKALHLGELPTDKKGRPILPWALSVVLRNTVPGLGRLFGTFESPSVQRDPGTLQTLGKQGAAIHGINVYVSPGKGTAREELALTNLAKGRAAERGEMLKSISNLPAGEATKRVAEFDRKTLIWAKQRSIPMKYLRNVKATGFYQGQPRQTSGSGLDQGSGGLTNLSSGKGLGG